MRVLAVDPGLTRCGIAVAEGVPGRTPTLIAFETFATPAHNEHALPERLALLDMKFQEWLDRYQPHSVAIERVFSQHNVSTAMTTAQVSALLMVAAHRRNILVTQHTPSEVKAAITGSGRADKKQVGSMVAKVLGLKEIPKPADSADAIALAICHIWKNSLVSK